MITPVEPLPAPIINKRSTATNGILDYSCNSNAYKTKGKTLFNNFKTFDKDSTVANCGTSRFYFLPRLMMGVLVIGELILSMGVHVILYFDGKRQDLTPFIILQLKNQMTELTLSMGVHIIFDHLLFIRKIIINEQ